MRIFFRSGGRRLIGTWWNSLQVMDDDRNYQFIRTPIGGEDGKCFERSHVRNRVFLGVREAKIEWLP